MAFEFPLATVLRLRRSVEKQEELALQKLLFEIAEAQRQIDALTAEIGRACLLLDQTMQQMLSAGEVDSISKQIKAALSRKQELLASLAELHRKREAQTRKYQSAHQSRRMLSDIQDRQREVYLEERLRAEQKFIDDVFGSRAQRK